MYQSTIRQRVATLCTYFPLPLKEIWTLRPCPNLVFMCTNLPYPTMDVLDYYIFLTFPLKQNCVLIPCPTLVILCTNLPYPTRYHIMTIFPPPIETKLCTYTLPNFSNIVYQFTLPNEVLHYVHISPSH